jgi:FkbM family methyltransferase
MKSSSSCNLDSKQLLDIFAGCFHSEGRGPLEKIAHRPWIAAKTQVGRWLAEAQGRSWKTKARLFWGTEMTVLMPDGVGIHLRRYGYFEKSLTEFFLHVIDPGAVFMDVGAHFGYFSLLASTLAGPRGKVLSIEPTPRTFDVLQENAALHENITCLACAATSMERDVYIQDMGTGRAAFNRVENEGSGSSVKVKGRRLDDVLDDLRLVPQVIKVDAERHEIEVLKGLSRTLKEQSPIVTLEVGDEAGLENLSAGLIAYMKEIGYEPYEIDGGRLVRHSLREQYVYDNLALLKPDRAAELKSRFRDHP